MKKVLLGLSIVFIFITFIGAIYVLTSTDKINAGYAVIPMLFVLICYQGYKTCEKREKIKKQNNEKS